MEHAWLDSLSEDWVSQPQSGSPAASLPSLSNSTSEHNSQIMSSRIPKYNPKKKAWTAPNDGGNSPLSERSLNDNNIPLSLRVSPGPSKLRELANGTRGRRTVSGSSSQSIQHNTVQHKSQSLSPTKGIHETPEWKRRLLHGEVGYGEQRDLFAPAGLENIFKPPPPQVASPNKSMIGNGADTSIAMPSSPPPYNTNRSSKDMESSEDDQAEVETKSRQPRVTKYKMTDTANFSTLDLSQSSSFQPAVASSYKVHEDNEACSHEGNSSIAVSSSQAHILRAERAISGQSDLRNEEFSPVYVARHNTVDGRVDFAALDLPADELKRRLEQIREEDPVTPIEQDEKSETVQEDNTLATDVLARIGGFVNMRRGGLSQEGSFQNRMLSPSSLPAIDESVMLPEDSIQASTPKMLPRIKKTRTSNEYQLPERIESPVVPPAPHPSPVKSTEQHGKSKTGSPLKLFGTYDTFTNQKLLRRLSQFEGSYVGSEQSEESPDLTRDSNRPELNDAFVAVSSPQKPSYRSQAPSPEKLPSRNQAHSAKNFSSFGEGVLDNFQFSEDVSYDSTRTNPYDDEKENMSQPALDPRTHNTFKFELDPSLVEDNATVQRQTKYTTTTTVSRQAVSIRKRVRPGTSSSHLSLDQSTSRNQELLSTPPRRPSSKRQGELRTPRKELTGDLKGKRLPRSPQKDPTPKRRRTLHRSEIEEDLATQNEQSGLNSLRETHQQIQSVVGRKRKDARHGDDQQAANPTVLAMRQILRPRTPTPSQRSSQMREPLQELAIDVIDREQTLQGKKLARIQAELDSTQPPKMFGGSQQTQNDSRKPSVTTQDFLDEAKKIMAGIRGKARPRSGLASVEESEAENDRNQTAQEEEIEDSYQDSTVEPFSRPPSREGGAPLPRLPKQQEDPELLDHLLKYQEKSDLDGVIASSMKSLALAKEAASIAKEIDRRTDETISKGSGRMSLREETVESDPPNIRLSKNPDHSRKRKHSASTNQTGSMAQGDDEFPSQGSNESSGPSTSRSIPTGSSRGSDSRRVIAPHTVSHLIPEQLAGMVFDRERNIWVKRKTVSGELSGQNYLPSDETDEDPFGDIPDLSVDETQELQRIKAVAAKRKEEERVAKEHSEKNEMRLDPTQSEGAKPRAMSGTEADSSWARSKLTRNSGDTAPEESTEGTSWEDQPVTTSRPNFQQVHKQLDSKRVEIKEDVIEEVDGEISILEDRVDLKDTPRKRNITISFSSPLASFIKEPSYDDIEGLKHDDSDGSVLSDEGSVIVTKLSGSQKLTSVKQRKTFRSASRRVSLGGHKFSVRPVSRIDERGEEGSGENEMDGSRRSISVVVMKTASDRQNSMIVRTPRPTHEIGTLTLTPLSEFTVHQADESLGLDVSYVAHNQLYNIGQGSKRTLSLSIKQLVEKITEVEPYEPFWEHMKQVDLQDKTLTTLHKLDEFCEQLEELDASHNQISHVEGIPGTVRHLRLTHNSLSDLTAWGHLMNLQYVDVSNNEIESLSGFKCLVHLRSLRADNNKIVSLQGVDQLDGLLSLRLRGNSIAELDFRGSKLQLLTDLDLQGNNISCVSNIHELRSLSTLNLVDNYISSFSMPSSESEWGIKYLKLSGNNLESLDVSQYPNLRLLYLDRNRLGTVTGLLKSKYLDSLSLREQHDTNINPECLAQAFEVRKLFLSGNLLGTFHPQTEFLNLQYLELANCGIESLPTEFGSMLPNVRVLNLNYNALKDITPLMGIVRLKKLHLAGNRLEGLRMITNLFSQCSFLALLDLRGNPITLGFYPPLLETRMVVHKGEETEEHEPYTLAQANQAKDDKYSSCVDMQTRIRRRLFDMFILGMCRKLKLLDGLQVVKGEVFEKRDKVWHEMVKLGYLVRPDGEELEPVAEEEEEPEDQEEKEQMADRSEAWQGEDSFA